MNKKWISIRMLESEINKIDDFRDKLNQDYGIDVSRNAFLRQIIFNNLDYQQKMLVEVRQLNA
jgi:hypothetical protein